jgi:hypothetical protein
LAAKRNNANSGTTPGEHFPKVIKSLSPGQQRLSQGALADSINNECSLVVGGSITFGNDVDGCGRIDFQG